LKNPTVVMIVRTLSKWPPGGGEYPFLAGDEGLGVGIDIWLLQSLAHSPRPRATTQSHCRCIGPVDCCCLIAAYESQQPIPITRVRARSFVD